jgi:hypothetical protein
MISIKPEFITNSLRRQSSLDNIDKFKWRSKLDESIDLLHDIVISGMYSPKQVDSALEKIYMYSFMGDCKDYGKNRTIDVMKNDESYTLILEKYDFV